MVEMREPFDKADSDETTPDQPGQNLESTEAPQITENLIKPDGRIDLNRALKLREDFESALKEVNDHRYDFYFDGELSDPEQQTALDDEYFDRILKMDEKFNIATGVILNTIDAVDDPKVVDNLLYNMRWLLVRAKDPMELSSLYSVYERVIKNFPKMKSCMQDKRMKETLETILLMSKYGDDEHKKSAVSFIGKNLSTLEGFLKSEEPPDKYLEPILKSLVLVLNEGTEQERDYIFEMTQNLLNDPKTIKDGAKILGSMFYREKKSENDKGFKDREIKSPDQVAEKARKILFDTLLHYGIGEEDAKQWVEDWTGDSEARDVFVEKNLVAVEWLEALRPGTTKLLSEKFGISHFGRYPDKMLIEQCENIENKERQYGIILYPRDDHNGAFHADEEVLRRMMYEMEDNPDLRDYLIRVYECGSKKDVAKALIDLNKTYGDHHKISFAIIGGHGTKNSIAFGQGYIHNFDFYSQEFHSRQHLTTKDLKNRRTHKARDFFEPGATVILASCSTGQNEGIGQTLSEKFGMKVVAPTEPTNIKKILPKAAKGKIDFDVEYSKKDIEAIYETKPV